MELLSIEGAVGTVRLNTDEKSAFESLCAYFESGHSVPTNEGMDGRTGGVFTRALRVLSPVLQAKGDSILSYLPGKYGRLPFSDIGIQIHVASINCYNDDLPVFMFGRTDKKDVFKGALMCGSYHPHVGDDLVRRLGDFAELKIFGMDSSTFPHPTDDYKDDVRLWGFGGIHDLGRIQQLYWLSRKLYEDLEKYCSLSGKEMAVLFRDARAHENVVIRDLSRIRYEKAIDEICAPIERRMKNGTWESMWKELHDEKKREREEKYKRIDEKREKKLKALPTGKGS